MCGTESALRGDGPVARFRVKRMQISVEKGVDRQGGRTARRRAQLPAARGVRYKSVTTALTMMIGR